MTQERFQELAAQAWAIWQSGGWAMYPLAACAVIIYSLAVFGILKLWGRGSTQSPDRAWRRWLRQPGRAGGSLGRILDEAMASRSMDELNQYFAGLINDEVGPFARDLKVLRVAVSSAPLLGLLGTVTGMLSTFAALATGGGGDKTMGMIAKGISEALITTETGLVIALSGMIFQYAMQRTYEKFEKTILHLEILCTQHLRKGGRAAPAAAPAAPPLGVPA
jgi:biopolymer transport protein ExbB